MGFFNRIRDSMNEEFVLGEDNVRRYREDPDSLDEILAEQHARGFGSERGLREFAQVRQQRSGLLDRVGQVAMMTGLGLVAGHLWNESRDD
jgi:hypothetical protein